MGNALRVPKTIDLSDSGLLNRLVLSRIAAAKGATRSELIRDLGGLVAHKLSPSELREQIITTLDGISEQNLATVSRGRYQLTDDGRQIVCDQFGCKALPKDWNEIRDIRLVADALGLKGQSEQRIKTLARPDGLRAAVLQQAYNIPGRRVPSPSRLRNALAVVALERAFGNKIKSGLDSGKGLSAKAGRMLAGQLSRRPRDFGTDTRLIAALAAEACGSAQTDAASLRAAILKNAVSRLSGSNPIPAATAAPALSIVTDNNAPLSPDSQPEPTAGRQRPAAASRPDLPGFAKIVLAAARQHGDGWAGNRKAFISSVWKSIKEAHPEWGVAEIEFKAMLTEAHRTGHIMLASADLKSKSNVEELAASAVSYKNTVWHYIRVGE